ncbi:MAG: isoprenylcysteine carboxylmethyltransferase family protein [Candidatus Pristimantibacillus sp.]
MNLTLVFYAAIITLFVLLLSIPTQMYFNSKKQKLEIDRYTLYFGAVVVVYYVGAYFVKLFTIFWFDPVTVTILIIILDLILLLHNLSIFNLSKNFSDSHQPKDSSVLVHKGMYRCVRHPIYSMFFFEGVLLSLISPWLIPLGMGCIIIPIYRLVILKEESYLIQRYGQAYTDYQLKVKHKIIPFIW